jgi:HEAT repeat protein
MGLIRADIAGMSPPTTAERSHERTQAGLVAQLLSGGVPQRRWAARDLAAYPETATVLGEHLLREPVDRVCEAIFTTLKTHANEAAVQALLPLLRSENAMLRNGAIDALSGMPERVAPRIDTLLCDPDPDVRIFTVNLLGELQHRQVQGWLLEVVRHDQHVNVVAAAIEVMAEVGEPRDLDTLRQAPRRFPADPFIAFAVDMAAERIRAA